MAQYRRDTHKYLADSNTMFEVVMVTDSNGAFYTTSNPLPIMSVAANTVLTAPWELQVARGKVANVTQVNVFGYSTQISNADYAPLWEGTGGYTFLSQAATLNVYSTSAADAGATVNLTGLDSNYNLLTETVTLNGLANVSTTNAFFRVNSFTMLTPNTNNQTNIGTIIAKNAANVALISANTGRMQNSWYTIPANHSLYISQVDLYSGETKSGATPTWFYFRVRNHNNVTGMHYDVLTTSFQNNYQVTRTNPFRYTQKSDIEWQFKSSDSGSHSVAAIIQGLLIPDNAP